MTAADRFRAADEAQADSSDEQALDASDIYDSERLAINKVFSALGESIGSNREGSGFQREVRERFAEIGFVARCDLKKDMLDPRDWDDKPWIPEITLTGRCEPTGEFDHDQMGHEVRSNILGKKGQDNVQKTQIGQTGFSRTSSGLILPG